MNCLYLIDSDPSAVVFPRTKVNISCWCSGSGTSLVVDNNFFYSETQPQTQAILDERGITVMPYSLNAFSGYIISTTATALSNETFFHCYSNDFLNNSPTVYIYAVYGKLICMNNMAPFATSIGMVACFLCRSSLSTKCTQFVSTKFNHTHHFLDCSMVPPS